MPDEVTTPQEPGPGGDQQAASSPLYPTGRLISTIKDDVDSSPTLTQDSKPAGDKKVGTDPGTANNIQDESGKAKGGEPDKGTGEPKKEEPKADDELSEGRFDKHPMFQRLHGENKKLRDEILELKGSIGTLLKMKGGDREEAEDTDADFENISDMEPDKIREAILEGDPKSFLANFARQIRAEIKKDLKGETQAETAQSAYQRELDSYASENSDFVEMWRSGEISDYMKKHPGQTAMSSHMRLTEPKRWETRQKDSDAKWQKKLDEAVKNAREEERRNAGARMQGSTVLPSTPGSPRDVNAEDSILKDTSKVGGPTNAILRILNMRRSS